MECVWLDFAAAADDVLAGGGSAVTAKKREWLYARVGTHDGPNDKLQACVGADGGVLDPITKKVCFEWVKMVLVSR